MNGTTVVLSLMLLHVTHACIWVAWVVSMAMKPEIAADVSIFCYYDYNESNSHSSIVVSQVFDWLISGRFSSCYLDLPSDVLMCPNSCGRLNAAEGIATIR